MTDTGIVRSVGEAKKRIDDYAGPATEFGLPIHESLLDPMGVNMAIITDCILARGWQPNGFVQHEDHRLYRYQDLE